MSPSDNRPSPWSSARWPLRVPVALALVASLAAAAPQRAADAAPGGNTRAAVAATGRIEGEVLISSALASRRPRFRIYDQPGPGARPPATETSEIRNVVLYLKDAPASPAGGVPRGARIDQVDEQFVPHVLPILRGATVEFPNLDDVFHNVFSLSSAREMDLGRFPRGASRSVMFDKAGIVQLFCHIHSNMSAVILVLDNPYFATPSRTGRYVIADVPPGDYTMVGWHERSRQVLRTVHVVAGETARVDFNIPVPPSEQPAR